MPEKYNGWTNYETWNVALWIDNEEGSHNFWRGVMQEIWEESEDEHPTYLTRSEHARQQLANRLKEDFETGKDELLEDAGKSASVWADLLGAALSEVNWGEIADNWLSDAEGYESSKTTAGDA